MQLWLAGVAGAVASPIILVIIAWGVRQYVVRLGAKTIDARNEARRHERTNHPTDPAPPG